MDPLRPLGSPPALAIDRLEVREAGRDGTLLVRCLGRGTAAGRPSLVLTSGARTFRFPALPVPAAAAGGPLRAAFSVPAELREALAAEPRLEIDGHTVRLPAPSEGDGPGAPPAVNGAGPPALLADRRAERAERAASTQADRADEAEALAAELAVRLARTEARLADAEDTTDVEARLGELAAELERSRQVAFAEGRRREEIEAEAAERVRLLEAERDTLRARLRDAERVRDELRGRVRELQRLRDTAHDPGLAPSGELARALAETAPHPDVSGAGTAPPAAPRPAGPADPAVLRREGELAARSVPEPSVGVAPVDQAPPAPSAAAELAAFAGPEPAAPAPDAPADDHVPGVWPVTAWPAAGGPADPERLDAARARLRAAPPDEDLEPLEPIEPGPEPRRPRGPLGRWRARRRHRRELKAVRANRPDAGA